MEEEIGVAAHIEGFPSDLNRKVLEGLVEVVDVDAPILPPLFVPVLGLVANASQFVQILLVERVSLEVIVVGRVELGEGVDAVVLKDITEGSQVVHHADLLDFVDRGTETETNQVRPYRIVLPILDLHSLLRDIHPCPTLTAEINHVEALKAIVLQLCMLGSKAHSLDLQSQSIQFDVP